jgi:cytochrome c
MALIFLNLTGEFEFMKPLVLFAAAAVSLSSGAALAADAQQLLKEKACLSCHTLDKKLVGPAYKEVAAKYKSRKDAQAYLAKKIREGSTGVWGQIPMPPNATVSGDDAKTLASYILTAK